MYEDGNEMNKIVQFATEELNKYLEILGIRADISLGLFEKFGVELQLEDPVFDDAIAISVKNQKGYVAGSNERSILIGVYRLLKEWGIYWVRPGKNGTYFPKESNVKDIEVLEAADKRHRIMCIEGSCSLENVLDMIEWLPKVGFNGYYIQFSNPYVFFDRWYNHESNPFQEPEGFTPEDSEKYREIMVKEIKKRGLMLHAMGHGWNCIPFGIPDNGWYALKPEEIPESYKNICAMINGERIVWNDTPLQGQLCYSDPYVRKTMVNSVVQYIKDNPEADVVYFWLGDYYNNTCECPECTKYHFSDYYMMMINDITDILVAEGLKTKIVFSIGTNKRHPPIVEDVRNLDNTMLMFAPITRNFGETMPDHYTITEIEEYKVNGYEWNPLVDQVLAGLYAWKQGYKGEVVDFDYHLMWDHVLDAGGEGIAKVIYQDIRNFDNLGMNGYISCQLQRNAFPTSIAMTVMANTLWKHSTDFEQLKRELYEASFGADKVEELCAYFECLSDAFDIGAIRCFKKVDSDVFVGKLERALKAMENFETVVDSYQDAENACHRESWKLLKVHKEIYSLIGKSMIARLKDDEEEGNRLHEEALRIAWTKEEQIQAVLDCRFLDQIVRLRMKEMTEGMAEFRVVI